MNLKKPDFWKYDKPNIYAYLLSPFSILIQLLNLLNLKKKNQAQNQNNMYWKYLPGRYRKNLS